ncbi:hypothetical protein KM1_301690 [Entamoeba histolytica HM-3:IMSS]|nr:hypothetical protein KM1_301690 [Entamoeba histolytica HM-3:IMSS]
MLWIYSP